MIEKVNPSHPDKIADRIAGALVDLAYKKEQNPKIAVEVLIGHGICHIIAETSVHFSIDELQPIVDRITKELNVYVNYKEVPQDKHLAENQSEDTRCGDNGIFKGIPSNVEELALSRTLRALYKDFPTDGKFIYDRSSGVFIACQSNGQSDDIREAITSEMNAVGEEIKTCIVNPLGFWTGGINVDTGATNRKLGSDMGRAVTGGGLHGKDLSKADVSVNVACYLLAKEYNKEVSALCAIGDRAISFESDGETILSMNYEDVVDMARKFIFDELGGFEELAAWGLF